MRELGAIFYRGPSLLTGDPIVGILTGLEGGSQETATVKRTATRTHDWAPRRPRLTPDQVQAIRAARAAEKHFKTIAIEFGISVSHAWRLCNE